MRYFNKFLVIISLFLSFIHPTFAKLNETFNTNSYNAALEFLESSKIIEPLEWEGLEIVSEEQLVDLSGNVNGYVYELRNDNQEGYIITRAGTEGDYLVMEASYEKRNPYADSNSGDNVYLGFFNYYSKNNDKLVDLIYDKEYKSTELIDRVSARKVDRAIEKQRKKARISVVSEFLPGISSPSNFPSLNQRLISPSHCSPTAAANVVRYATQKLGLQFKNEIYYSDTEYGSQFNGESYTEMGKLVGMDGTGYGMLIALMGDMMGTTPGRDTGATHASDVDDGLEDFLNEYTNFTAWVSYWYNNSTNEGQLQFEDVQSYIDAGYPVLVTVGNAIYQSTLGAGYHTLTVFGYRTNGMIYVCDPYGSNTTQYSGTRTSISYDYIESDTDTVYGLYRVVFNY